MTQLGHLLQQPVRFERPALPAINGLRSAAERVLARWPDVVAEPPENDRDKLVAEMRRRLEAEDWEDLKTSYVTSAARALFDERRRDRADLEELRQFYYAEIRVSTSVTFLGAMASVYVGSYVPGARHTRELADALRPVRARIGARWNKLDSSIPAWLDPVEAPKAVAACMASMPDPWAGLKDLGVRSPHAPGLMDHAHLGFVEFLKPQLKQRAGLEWLFGWVKPQGQSARTSGAAEAINAVLGHWRNVDPPAADLRYITQTLVSCYSDPRVENSGGWAGVPQDLKDIILRWLTGENIRFFLDVVSAVEDSHMWEPRRKFWLGLHEQKRIDMAWVAFSEDAARYASRQAAGRDSRGTLRYGRQVARGARVDTSLLVLKIGAKIVVEGSHSYKVHMFRDSNPKAPQLYKAAYDCEAIRLTQGAEAKSHHGDWQGWVLERI